MSGGRKSRGGRGGGRGSGRTGGNGGHGGAGQHQGGGPVQNPVEFYLYASELFPMEQCPAQRKPAAVDGAIRLAMPIREHLGDIIAWFSAMAPADPTARLVVCQATKSDKAWLQAFVKEGFSAQLQYNDVLDHHGNKLLQFSLLQAVAAAAVPPPPPPTAAAKHEQPAALAAAGSQQPIAAAKEAVANAAQHAKDSVTEAGHKAGEAAAAAVGKAKEAAAAAAAKAQEAGKAASSSIAAAVQQANGGAPAEGEGSKQARTWSWSYGSSWFEGAQDALTGKSGPNAQLMAVGGIALAVTTVVLGVLLGGKRKSRA